MTGPCSVDSKRDQAYKRFTEQVKIRISRITVVVWIEVRGFADRLLRGMMNVLLTLQGGRVGSFLGWRGHCTKGGWDQFSCQTAMLK